MSRSKINDSLIRIGVISLLAVCVCIGWLAFSLRSVESGSPNKQPLSYTVEKGMTFNSVLKDLKTAKMIRSYHAAKLIQSLFHLTLKQGMYNLIPEMSTWQILNILSKGADQLISITFPEGFSSFEIYTRLQSEGFENTKDFLNIIHDPRFLSKFHITGSSAEGFLFPSTYYIPKHISGKELATLMIKTFFEKSIALTQNISPAILNQKVILASIIEKEARSDQDRALIASVFVNRLQKHMRLEASSTILYILAQQGIKKNRVFYKDLEIDSPYNTYRHGGLPPAISNPGLASLRAAFFPAKTNYLFFVYKSNGEHFFTDNYNEHMKAYKEYYLKSYGGIL